jgi:uncharacterized protein YbjT (DUF2867 family)
MDTPKLIAVTGATGALGGRVAARLAAAGVRQRLVVRDPSRARTCPTSRSPKRPTTMPTRGEAFTGTDAVFLVSAAEDQGGSAST